MKITLEHITEGADEVVVRFRERTPEVDALIRSLEQPRGRICAERDGVSLMLHPSDVLYMESVDSCVYAYLENDVARTSLTLASAESTYTEDGFFRCSKSMVINIYHISYLRSISGNRVEVTMDNGERVIISRRYVRALRRILKGEQP